MSFDWEDFSPKENALYGEEIAKGAAHRAVRFLFDRRILEGKKQEEVAASIGKDPAWLSRSIRGPANWTLKTLGALVVALDGDLTIKVDALEDREHTKQTNYDAYDAIDHEVFLINKVRYPVGYKVENPIVFKETEATKQHNSSHQYSSSLTVGSAS